jgi:hypothetical protein
MAELEDRIRPLPSTPINRDFAPIACHLGLAAWTSRFHPGYGPALPWAAALVPLLLLWPARRFAGAAGMCVAAMGFTQIGLEMMLLLGFQAVHGYLYHQLAGIVAGFMAGMALGSWLGGTRFSLRQLQLAASASGLIVLASLTLPAPLYPVLALACGLLGGYQFVAAGRRAPAAGAGTLYALDLAGACAAALLFTIVLIPVMGFLPSALLIAALNLLTAAASRR